MALARDYVYKAHLQTEQVGENKKHIFISTAKCCQVLSDKGDINILYQQLHAALRCRLWATISQLIVWKHNQIKMRFI